MANDTSEQQAMEVWRDLEHSHCFYCDKPWDHYSTNADGTLFYCEACAERYHRTHAGLVPDTPPEPSGM